MVTGARTASRFSRRQALKATAGVAAASALGSVGSNRAGVAAAVQDERQGTLIIAIDSDPQNLEPGTNLAFPTGSEIILNLFDTLLTWKAPAFAELEGRLAETWSIADDGRTYTFALRPDVTFHDGTAVDAEAIKFSFART